MRMLPHVKLLQFAPRTLETCKFIIFEFFATNVKVKHSFGKEIIYVSSTIAAVIIN